MPNDERGLGQMGGQPILIMGEDAERKKGKDALSMNIQAGKVVGETVRTTLGPKGMDKMLVDNIGDIVITNDGATILEEMDVEHPAAKMMVEVSESQEENAGDGTTTAVALSGELLKKAEDLLDQDIHASVITKGYRMASMKAEKILEDISMAVEPDDEGTLKKIAQTSITGKSAETAKEHLSDLTIGAIKEVMDRENGINIDLDNIKMEKKEGGSIEDSKLIQGVIIDKEKVHNEMPEKVEDAKIALIDSALEVEETETDAELNINSPDQLQDFLDQEEEMLKEMVNKIKQSGANVVMCQKGIDDLAQHYLAKEGILAIRRVKKSDMSKLARATGGTTISKVDDLTSEDLGNAGTVYQEKIAGSEMTMVEDCKNPKSVSVLIRGGTEHVVDEVERSLEDSLKVVKNAIKDGKILPGGGAPEIELSLKLQNYAKEVGGKEQLAIESFAEAMEIIPKTLAENAGMDQIDAMVTLRNRHSKNVNAGIDVLDTGTDDMLEAGVIEPLTVASQAVKSASDAATMILRIDDVISGGSSGGEEAGGPGGPGGPGGGMPGGMGGMM